MTTKRFIKPFGEDGLRVPISDEPSGTDVNYQTGYSEAYGFDPVTDPEARFVQLTEENQILNDITGNLKLWQENVFPDFITAANNGGVAWKYKKGDTVLYNGDNYESLEDNNTDLPTTEKWVIKKPNEVLRAIFIGLGYSGNYGFFEKGFVYREVGDLGFSSDGVAYVYAGVDLLPVTVQNGTDPEASSNYESVIFNKAEALNVTNANGGTAQDQFNFKDGLTVSEAINYIGIANLLGSRVWLTDRQAWFQVVLTATAGTAVNGMDLIRSAVNNLYSFHLIIFYPLSLRALGAKFDSDGTTGNGTDNSDIIQRGDDLVASGMTLLFDVKGVARITKKITKNQNSIWDTAGAGKPRFSDDSGNGVSIFSDHAGVGVEVINLDQNLTSAWGQIKNITIFGDYVSWPSSVGLRLSGVRWQIIKDVFVHSFDKCITGISTLATGDGQKLHFIRIHAFNALSHGCYIYGYDDCWFNESELSGNVSGTDGVIALELDSVKSSQLNSSRYQIAETNLLIKNCVRVQINGGITDLAGGVNQESTGNGVVIEDSGSIGIHGTEFYDNNGSNIKIRTSGASEVVARVTIDGTVHKQDNASSTALEIENNGGAINRVNFDESNDVGDCDNKVVGYNQLGAECNIGNFITKQRRLNITDGTANVIQPQQYDTLVATGAITTATTIQFSDNGHKTGQIIKFYDKRSSGGANIQFLQPNGDPIAGANSSSVGEVREFYCASATSWESLTTN